MEEEAQMSNGLFNGPLLGIIALCSYSIVPLLAQMYKWVLVTEQGWRGAEEVTSIGVLIFFNTRSECMKAI